MKRFSDTQLSFLMDEYVNSSEFQIVKSSTSKKYFAFDLAEFVQNGVNLMDLLQKGSVRCLTDTM